MVIKLPEVRDLGYGIEFTGPLRGFFPHFSFSLIFQLLYSGV
jgi:hypothetical protein